MGKPVALPFVDGVADLWRGNRATTHPPLPKDKAFDYNFEVRCPNARSSFCCYLGNLELWELAGQFRNLAPPEK